MKTLQKHGEPYTNSAIIIEKIFLIFVDKVLIEESNIELLELFDKVSEEARKEKLSVPPINKILYFWTRKPLIVGRAVVLASTLDKLDVMRELLGLSKEKRAYIRIPNKGLYQKKLGQDPAKIKVLDPFAGSGNLIFPSVELGLDVTCSDYNPLAYLIEKSILEFPAKYGSSLSNDFENIANELIAEIQQEVSRFFKPKHLAYLWIWCITCPHCSQRVPLTNQMWIAKTKDKKIGVRFTPKTNKNFDVELIHNMTESEGKKFTQKGGKSQCIRCGDPIAYELMASDIAKNKDREMIAIQVQKPRGRDYILPSTEDKQLYDEAVRYFKSKENEFEKENLIPNEDILATDSLNHRLWKYGITHWREFFSERQLLSLVCFSKLIQQKPNNTKTNIMKLYLGFLLCRVVFSNVLGLVWDTTRESPATALTMRQPGFAYNHVEINPFEKVRGSFKNNVANIKKAIEFASRLNSVPKCSLESITSDSNKYDLIITDPPYGDDVQYGEFSEFFYVWLYRILGKILPELPSRVLLDEDFCESQGRFGNPTLASKFFEAGMKKSFVSLNRKLKDDGLLVVFFAHSSIKAWNQLLTSIREGKFRVVSSYAIHTESTSNVIAKGKTSFMSSIVVACRKINEDSEEFFENIVPQIEDNIKTMLEKIPEKKLLTLPITDLLIMVYGKVLESCTKHTVLKSRRKDFFPDFETLISGARSFIMKQLIKKLTHKSMNTVGPRMAFYLLIKIFHRGVITGDNLSKIAKIYGIEILVLEKDNIIKNDIINNQKIHRLYYLSEIEMNYPADNVDKNNLHQQLGYLAYLVETRGAEKIPPMLERDNFREDNLKQIVSLILKSYSLRKNKGETINTKENKEIEILHILSDIMGIKREEGLDSYF